MNREQMIEVVRVYLRANMHDGQTGGLTTMPWDLFEAEAAEFAVDALVAAGCVPPDALTRAAREVTAAEDACTEAKLGSLPITHANAVRGQTIAIAHLRVALAAIDGVARGVSATPEAEQ